MVEAMPRGGLIQAFHHAAAFSLRAAQISFLMNNELEIPEISLTFATEKFG